MSVVNPQTFNDVQVRRLCEPQQYLQHWLPRLTIMDLEALSLAICRNLSFFNRCLLPQFFEIHSSLYHHGSTPMLDSWTEVFPAML